jgi:PAS domain S-box-containing protein
MKTGVLKERTRPPEPAATQSNDYWTEALRLSELRYRRLFETAHDGILILNAESGEIMDVNPFLIDLLDYPFEELRGRKLWEIGQFKDIAANRAAFEKLQQNEYIRYENLPLRRRDGKQIQVEFVSNVYWVEADKVIQCNIRDITARAERRHQSDAHLAALELASKTKDHVLAMLSHELRTPLAAISYAADFLAAGDNRTDALDETDVPPHADQSAVALIRRNVRSLMRMINELLDLTHLAKGTLHLKFETIDAHEVIQLAVKNLESQQNGVDIKLHFQAQRSEIRTDRGKLEQIMSNLIGNALKFTPRGSLVSIATRNEDGSTLVIEVSDTGIGISPGALGRIFSPFEQEDSSVHPRFGGLGLGLSIARTLMEAQDGSLKAESLGPGQGAKFTACFKVDDSPLTAKDQSSSSVAETSADPSMGPTR